MIANCIQCNNEFKTKPFFIKIGQGKFCSRECYGVSMIGKQSNRKGKKYPHLCGKNHWHYKNRIEIKCEYCGVIFKDLKCNNRKFCSRKCASQDLSLKLLGDKNHYWKGGKTLLQRAIRLCGKYNLWRADILERDNYTCQHCGLRGNILQVDHIKPLRSIIFNNDIMTMGDAYSCDELWDITNGRVLCKNCHKSTDTYGKHNLELKKI